ncbi:MAG TPA: DotU/TssL family secretion system protein [Pseudomonas sp.]|nr:DotU/TssL family secretion system protein [Pseudomonas sp.]
MAEGSMGLRLAGPDASPLSAAFGQAWREWLSVRQGLENAEDSDGLLLTQTAERATQITRRLWRNAFAQVGEAASGQVRAMAYAFVALIDETLLFTPWVGQAAWQEKPLESRLYGSRSAGERIPVAIKKVLDERAPASRDLANVYLQCMILGFHGRLRGPRGAAIHEKWRHALFAFAWQRDPVFADVCALLERPTQVAPQRLPVRRSLPDGFRLGLLLLAMALLLTVVGHLLWQDIAQELEPVRYLSDELSQPEEGA